MASFQLLEPREEDELHKSRLLNVEEKPFKRISKRLLAPYSFLTTLRKLPTPPPDTTQGDNESQNVAQQQMFEKLRQFREDILFDFNAFDSALIRVQFLRNSNERERERYRDDKARILETAQHVRESNAQLRIQLDEAKNTLKQRKKFDELAERITGNRLLRPREDQMANLRKLEEECRELERESKNYKVTWAERREKFGRIVEEGMQLRRMIRDEKEEVERREGMAEEEDGENVDSASNQTPRHLNESGTPKYQNGRTELPDTNGRPESRSKMPSKSNNSIDPGATEGKRLESVLGSDDCIMEDVVLTTFVKPDSKIFETNNAGISTENTEDKNNMDTS